MNKLTKGKKEKQLSHINQDWYWTWIGGDAIASKELKWWERIIYWKFKDKSYKKSLTPLFDS